MAIEFNCPYCTASIRVLDSAAGKQGTCPKCETKLIVPSLGPPRESSPPKTTAVEAGNEPATAGIPDFAAEPPAVIETPAMANQARRRAKRKGTNPLIPIALFGVVIGVVVYWMMQPKVHLEGKLFAERIVEFEIPPGRIDKSAFERPAEETGTILEEMQQRPPGIVRDPDAMEMQFEPDDKGLQVRVRETLATQVFRVKSSAVPAIRQFINQHADEIRKQQDREYRQALKSFLQDWQTSRKNHQPFVVDTYRNSLGFNRLTGAVGYCIQAQIGGRPYRCVHEDDRGDLYFLLPKKTDKFLLLGRELPDGRTIFPGRFTVEVKNPAAAQAAPEDSPEANESEIPPLQSTGEPPK